MKQTLALTGEDPASEKKVGLDTNILFLYIFIAVAVYSQSERLLENYSTK